jgi:hypothetical protein
MKKAGKCIHYNGTVNDCCAAGVNYKQLAGPGEAWATRLPCHGPEYRTGLGNPLPRADTVSVCDKRQEPTPEEIAADERAMKESMERYGKARAAIVAHLGGPWKKGASGASAVIDCPCCAGKLQFSRAGYNGHIHARCSTAGCVAWME